MHARPWSRLLPTLIVLCVLGCAHAEERAPAEVAPVPPPIEKPVLMGTVTGADGKPLPLAHVHVGKKSYAVNADGSFRIEPEEKGFTEVRFSGVNHGESSAAVWLEDRASRVNVRLGTHPREETLSRVGLIVEKDGKLAMKAAQPMQRREDGTWALTVEAPTGRFAYQLLHVSSGGHTLNGTQGETWEYDGGGDYLSVLQAPGGPLEIIFDPKKLPQAGAAPEVTPVHPRDAKLTEWVSRLRARDAAVNAAVSAAMKEGRDPQAARIAAVADGGYLTQYSAALRDEQDPAVRQLLMVAVLGTTTAEAKRSEDIALAELALSDIDARSDLWAVDVGALNTALTLATDRAAAAAYEKTIIESHPTEDVSAALLFHQLVRARESGALEQAKQAFLALTQRFPDSRYTFFARRIDPTAEVRPGGKIPAFAFPVYGDPAKKLTPAQLAGKTYLISLWASWCKPCIAKLDTLHALQRKYGAKGFTVLAVAIQDQEAAVKTFRTTNAKKWPMPWLHAYVPEESADATMKQLAAVGLPSSLLVGPDGTILATNSEIDREGLETLVDAAMAPKK